MPTMPTCSTNNFHDGQAGVRALSIPHILKSLVFWGIVFFPFQESIRLVSLLGFDVFPKIPFLNFLDEILVAISIVGFSLLVVCTLKIKAEPCLIISAAMAIGSSMLSGFINDVSAWPMLFGSFDVYKNIFVLLTVTVLPWEKDDLERVLKISLRIAIFLAWFSILEQILFQIGFFKNELAEQRMGLYRIASLTGINTESFYGFYIVFWYFLIPRYIKSPSFIALSKAAMISALIFTGSRQAWMGILVLIVLQNHGLKVFFRPKNMFLVGIFGSGFLFLMIKKVGFNLDPDSYYRLFALKSAFEIFLDHPIFGVGPSRFGGVGSIIFNSPIYAEYNWPDVFILCLESARSLDSFWPQVIVENGLWGFSSLLLFFWLLQRIAKKSTSDMLGSLISNYVIVIFLAGWLTGINKPFMTLNFFCIAGIFLKSMCQKANLTEELT